MVPSVASRHCTREARSRNKLLRKGVSNLLVVPSRRSFEPQFGETSGSRQAYASSTHVTQLRSATLNNFAQRLFDLDRNPEQRKHFDALIAQVIGYAPNWTIDLNDSGNFFLKFVWDGLGESLRHSSEGLGDGLISLIVILDAIRDTEPGSTVVIDEPELSLHPQYQRRLRALLSANATDRQIVYATHSPYFIDWADVAAGAQIIRVHKTPHGTSVASPSREALDSVLQLGASNQNNPHVLGLNANEVFFLEGGIVLAEGQEDVVLLPQVLDDVGINIHGSFFGWGVGGADNMRAITQLLHELGYPLVAGVLDQDKTSLAADLGVRFPGYRSACIPTDDVRDKLSRKEQAAKTGLMGSDRTVRPEYRGAVTSMFHEIKTYFTSGGEHEIV